MMTFIQTKNTVYSQVGQMVMVNNRECELDSLILADGRLLSISNYPKLYDVMKYTYGGSNVKGYFRVPDCYKEVTIKYSLFDKIRQCIKILQEKIK